MKASSRRLSLAAVAAMAMAGSLLTVAPASATEDFSAKLLSTPEGAVTVPDEYIVMLKPDAKVAASAGQSVASAFTASAEESGVEVTQVFDAIGGFAASMDDAELQTMLADPAVEFVEPNMLRTINGLVYEDKAADAGGFNLFGWLTSLFGFGGGDEAEEQAEGGKPAVRVGQEPGTPGVAQANATWGLDRIDARSGLDKQYNPGGDGTATHSYIIDTGVNTNHQEFSGRIGNGYDSLDRDSDPMDCNGHGTHVAGTVGGTTYGVAKKTTIHGVRVLGCDGSGSTQSVVAGMDWVAKNAQKPAVANMSLGGGASAADDAGVRRMVQAGVTVVVAAGNDNQDACNYSPAREPEAITVASSTNRDTLSSFSNWGRCVDIIAPGSDITSAWYTSASATNTISGTSMASPHVAGVAAVYLGKNPSATPQSVTQALTSAATPNAISDSKGSPNKLAYVVFDGADQPAPEPDPGTPDPGTPDPGTPDPAPEPDPGMPAPGNPAPEPDPGMPTPGNPDPAPEPDPGMPAPGNPGGPGMPMPNPQPGDPVVVPGQSPECGWVTHGYGINAGNLMSVKEVPLWMTDRLVGCVRSTQGSDVDLYLQMKDEATEQWRTVAKAISYGQEEQIVVDAPPGFYRFVVHAYDGGGAFRFGYSRQ